MPTLRTALADKIEIHSRAVARHKDRLELAPASLLDLDVPCDRVWTFYRSGPKTLEVMYATGSEEEQRAAASFIMDALGATSGTKEIGTMGDPSISITHETLPGTKVMVERSPDCHTARIVQESTIEYCGTLDESKYLSVDYLDLERQLTTPPPD